MLSSLTLRGTFGSKAIAFIQKEATNTAVCCCPKRYNRKVGSHVRNFQTTAYVSSIGLLKQWKGELRPRVSYVLHRVPKRNFLPLAFRIVRHFAKVRYLILGGVGTGAVSAKLTYDKWKSDWNEFIDRMPNGNWMKDYYQYAGSFGNQLEQGSDKIKELLADISSLFVGVAGEVIDTESEVVAVPVKEEQISVMEPEPIPETSDDSDLPVEIFQVSPPILSAAIFGDMDKPIMSPNPTEEEKLRERLQRAQEELLEMQQKFQREIDRLENENKELRKQAMLKGTKSPISNRKIKKSVIDMYSDALDLLAEYDANYSVQDHLPRVVVVGDQSTGKTSVLEMIARARIFPRGAGEMMTRCPIMVTLTEGPHHIAFFKGSTKEYDLTKDLDLQTLREEVERRMKRNVKEGQSVSTDVLSMYVRGPGLPRMVLVDLPGIISTVTAGMSPNSKQAIHDVSKYYMSNPNAIILCIQDGSVDAERSIVTDLVSSMDPQGKRTILVLTKVDVAEQNEANPSRIKKILSGKLLPMKALGYFAVVTGTGNTNDSIDHIRQYEEDFFRSSQFFKTGVLKASQMTTQNLSFAVANCFWNMVKESIEQQADTFKARKFNIETEWKNNFPGVRELDRDELFDKARGEILDEVLSLSQISPQHWEEVLSQNMWKAISKKGLEEIYLPSAQTNDPTKFKTQVDILTKQWADKELPYVAVHVGWETLLSEFAKAMDEGVEIGGRKDPHTSLFDDLKNTVKSECEANHKWQSRAEDGLRVIQLTALEDSNVPDKYQWDAAVKFMEDTLRREESKTEEYLRELIGPGWQERWYYWTSRSSDQHMRNEIKKELERLLQADPKHLPELDDEEITTVKRNLLTNSVEADPFSIVQTWKTLYRVHFLERASQGAQECRKAYYHRYLARNELECNDVVLFWRFQRMLSSTSNAIRQQIMNTEARRLEGEVKQVLDEISENLDHKKSLIKGKQVDLAEELKRVRHIQASLEQFIEALKREKSG